MRNLLWRFVANEQAAAAIDLLAAGIAGAIVAVIASLGSNLNTAFSSVSTSMN